jgi:L-asparaginase II
MSRCDHTSHSHGETPERGEGADPSTANPVLVEVTRGPIVESFHRAAFAVVAADGKVAASAGDILRPVYPRSAIKPVQALALIETGAADAFGLGDAQIALACASHAGEPRHVETVRNWLAHLELREADLECGAHPPYDDAATRAILASGAAPDQTHNNCSGKHSGFLTIARHLGAPTKGYIRFEHPVQQRVLGILEQMSGLDLDEAPRAIDGCGIPTIGMPLGNIALAMARLADPGDQPDTRQAACARIRAAIAAEPFMISGTGRFDSVVTETLKGRALVKGGAEGVSCASLPELGLGVAVKADDGEGRAANVVMAAVLQRLEVIGRSEAESLATQMTPPVRNRVGRVVGEIRPARRALF